MLITPRTYRLAQIPDKGLSLAPESRPAFRTLGGWSVLPADRIRAAAMLLIDQIGSVRVGEVARYTLTYIPSADRILPTPHQLYVKVRNTSAIPLRAAYLHGPYTFNVSCYPSTFDPNNKFEDHETEGTPQFEPNLKAGGVWDAVIPVPERVRKAPTTYSHPSAKPAPRPSITWIIEISSQVIFSSTAAVHFEVIVGRDEKSTELGAGSIADLPAPGLLHENSKRGNKGPGGKSSGGKVTGIYSDSVKLEVDDTSSLWSTPRFPSWEDADDIRALEQQQSAQAKAGSSGNTSARASTSTRESRHGASKRKKVHFVVLTHGLHSNLGADMLYLKESIDATAKKAREDAKRDRKQKKNSPEAPEGDSASRGASDNDEVPEDEDELVIVRGFPGNAVRTERGIQYLGKRLAKYVLLVTYPDQPYLPVKKTGEKSLSRAFGFQKRGTGRASHQGSTIHRQENKQKDYAYNITSISFIGHSLGGLVQTYAIAYIQKHSPEFFDHIKPVNFVALASPFLGLSNENPLYVKFALDFGLVGRTGQDLGLSWSAPKMRSGWSAMIGGLGTADTQKAKGEPDPGSKPLLRILPTGPAHQVLKKFRNRTVYSNVVNDGIVPLRTSCLLFLDWRGLDRVEKARRENGLVGTMAEWGWAEITGANSRSPRPVSDIARDDRHDDSSSDVPQPSGIESPARGVSSQQVPTNQSLRLSTNTETPTTARKPASRDSQSTPHTTTSSPFNNFLAMFRPQLSSRSSKATKMMKRSQTLGTSSSGEEIDVIPQTESARSSPLDQGRTRGDSLYDDEGNPQAPPRTTILESAGDLLNPPLPTSEFILDPSSRPRTIFHDRIYHPDDIPIPPPAKQRSFFLGSNGASSASVNSNKASGNGNSNPSAPTSKGSGETTQPTSSGMKVEEKIARAYHRELSWRKVLVSLEPDAHNNIIVRRKFANAYGWPVVKHIVDTHFGYTTSAQTADALEEGLERALPASVPAAEHGNEVIGQETLPGRPIDLPHVAITDTDIAAAPISRAECNEENDDEVPEMAFSTTSSQPRLASSHQGNANSHVVGDEVAHRSPSSPSREPSERSKLSRQDSARWTDRYFDDDGDDDEEDYVPSDEDGRGRRVGGPRLETHDMEAAASVPILSDELTKSPVPVAETESHSTNK